MPIRKCLLVAFLIATFGYAAAAQDAVESFWDLALSRDFGVIERHLPREFVEAATECDLEFREKPVGLIHIPDTRLEEYEVDISGKPDVVRFRDTSRSAQVEVRLVSKYLSSQKAALGVVMTVTVRGPRGESHSEEFSEIVNMAFIDGSWRATRLALPQKGAGTIYPLDASIGEQCRQANESSAVGNLRAINIAQVTYAATFPELGFAARMAQFGPPGERQEPNWQAFGLLDARLGCAVDPCVKSGFNFRIQVPAVLPRDSYKAFARPATFGKTGTRSFYTDESGVIRFTTEDRDATAKDPALE